MNIRAHDLDHAERKRSKRKARFVGPGVCLMQAVQPRTWSRTDATSRENRTVAADRSGALLILRTRLAQQPGIADATEEHRR